MTILEFERIVVRLANVGFVRYWLQGGPLDNPWSKMVLSVPGLGDDGVSELRHCGFRPEWRSACGGWVYIVDRHNEDGSFCQGGLI